MVAGLNNVVQFAEFVIWVGELHPEGRLTGLVSYHEQHLIFSG